MRSFPAVAMAETTVAPVIVEACLGSLLRKSDFEWRLSGVCLCLGGGEKCDDTSESGDEGK